MAASDTARAFVIGTAGHIDHGKSALVKAITGTDPDRLPIEKERGMTTDLGFATLTLPSGAAVSVVDIPGHERFVSTMVAGATGIDGVLLVVAANEGVMPQTREHVDILDLLQIDRGVVALTKCDLVDDSKVRQVSEDIAELLNGTALEAAARIPVSVKTGAGLQALMMALDRLTVLPLDDEVFSLDQRTGPPQDLAIEASSVETGVPQSHGLPKLPIDRVFTLAGFGTIVTGTVTDGSFIQGQPVEIAPRGLKARIRGIESHNVRLTSCARRGRIALNLSGLEAREIDRGDVVTIPGGLMHVNRFDARLRLLSASKKPLKPSSPVVMHAGSMRAEVNIIPLQSSGLAPGEAGWVRVRLRTPCALWRGQRFILRQSSPAQTLGGGIIADVSPSRRSLTWDAARLEALISKDLEVAIQAAVSDGLYTLQQLAQRLSLNQELLLRAVKGMEANGAIGKIGSRYLCKAELVELQERVHSNLTAYHRQWPRRSFMPREELRRVLRLDSNEFADLLGGMVDLNLVRVSQEKAVVAPSMGGVALPSHIGHIEVNGCTASEEGPEARLLRVLKNSGTRPPATETLLSESGATEETLRRLIVAGQVVRIERGVHIARHVRELVVQEALTLLDVERGFTIGELRDVLVTSRKCALAFASYLDDQNITRRVEDRRIAGRAVRAHRP